MDRGRIGLFVGMAAFSLAVLGTQLICSNDSPEHILIWHVVPFGLVASLGIFAGLLVFAVKSSKLRLP